MKGLKEDIFDGYYSISMKDMNPSKLIWTIGHSTRTAQELNDMLHSFQIELLVDVRSYPGSRKFPHFNKEAIQPFLKKNKIDYLHMKALGGRRRAKASSKNTAWRSAGFRGYADYMETEEFKKAIDQLQEIALEKRTAYMCSEALWWRCHRSLISDYLKLHGWTVMHIMGIEKETEHPYTSPAKIIKGELSYQD